MASRNGYFYAWNLSKCIYTIYSTFITKITSSKVIWQKQLACAILDTWIQGESEIATELLEVLSGAGIQLPLENSTKVEISWTAVIIVDEVGVKSKPQVMA